tara:strand:+ start:51 stop:320 length:270 start_codon:yes stop_codon:yes gene_type:complete
MSQINESLVKNLVSVFAGVALANKLGKRFSGAGKPSAKSAEKLINKDPELKKLVNKLQQDAESLEKEVAAKVKKLSPESQAKFNKIFGK